MTGEETIDTTDYDLGAVATCATASCSPPRTWRSLNEHDAILLGAIGDPRSVPAGVLERGLLLPLRFKLDHAVNLRPATLYQGPPRRLGGLGEI